MNTISPYLAIKNAEEAMKFYEKAFGAKIETTLKAPDGKVMHGRLSLGNSVIMVMDEAPQMGLAAPDQNTTVVMHLNLPNVDEFFAQVTGAGAKAIMPPMDMFWGDRYCQFVDPYGHRWSVGTKVKDMTEAEIEAAAREAFAQMGECAQKPVEV